MRVNANQFAGLYRDSEDLNDSATYRRYNPSLARWLSPDPAGMAAADPTNPQSWNRYAYALNSPTNMVDPLGLDPSVCNGTGDEGEMANPCEWYGQGWDGGYVDCPASFLTGVSACPPGAQGYIPDASWGGPPPLGGGGSGGTGGAGGGAGGGGIASGPPGSTPMPNAQNGPLGPCNGDPTGCASDSVYFWELMFGPPVAVIYVVSQAQAPKAPTAPSRFG